MFLVMSYIPLSLSCREEDEEYVPDHHLYQISEEFDPNEESLLSEMHFAQTGSSVPGQWLSRRGYRKNPILACMYRSVDQEIFARTNIHLLNFRVVLFSSPRHTGSVTVASFLFDVENYPYFRRRRVPTKISRSTPYRSLQLQYMCGSPE